jgi:hypothetical protein
VPGEEEADAMAEQIREGGFSDPNLVFEDIKDYVDMILDGIQPSLVITGDPGIGKTFTVLQQLKKQVVEKIEGLASSKGEDYRKISGDISAFGLYRTLFMENGKLLIFDDIDSVWTNRISANILKAALDSTGDRELSYEKAKTFNPEHYDEEEAESMIARGFLPSPFNFTGKIIFISNMRPEQMDSAVLDRSMHVDLNLKPEDIFDIISRLKFVTEIPGNPSREIRETVFELIKNNFAKKGQKPSVRMFRICTMLYDQAIKKNKGEDTAIRRVFSQIM